MASPTLTALERHIASQIAACETIIGHRFTNPRLILEAVNMVPSVIRFREQSFNVPKNTRMAVYGDSAAELNLCTRWVNNPTLTKEQWSTMRRDLLGNVNLARVGFSKGLDRCINLNPGTNVVSEAMMATTVEAILGAVSLDGGDDALGRVMSTLGLSHE